MKKNIVIFIILCVAVSLLYLTGLLFFLTDHEPYDNCEMTYMFEYPQYVRVSQEIDKKYPKYGLYAYGEGRMTKKARNMYFDGIPVLFIPGNAGSHQQVRSLSSIALRKALNSGIPYHFDYFTVDLNSEFSALYGPVLYDQLNYVLKSIDRILELYKNSPSKPKHVVLVGHSVGGIVARKTISSLLKNNKHLVSIMINLASPLTREPIYFDRYGSKFYATSSYEQENITSVSIAGGYSDILVPSYLAVNEGNNSINLVSTNIAKSWVESNHVQILWCKQTVLAINRALFDSVDRNTHQISTDPQKIRKIFKHHLIHNSGTQLHITGDPNKLTKIDYKGEWIESLYKQYTVDLKHGVKQPHWYMVGITNQPTYEMLTVLAINLEVTNWAFVCNAAYPNKASRVCIEAEHLTQYSEIAPTSRYKRRLLTINMHDIRSQNKEYTHVVFRTLPTSEPVTFHVDIYGSYERGAQVSLPMFSLSKQVVVQQTPEKALVFNLIFPELSDPLQIYQLFVEPVRCSNQQHAATASLIVPWANENVHFHFTESSNKPLILRLQNAKPASAGDARVRLILEPSCTYKISVRLHILGVFGQIARYYSTFLISTLAVIFLLAFQSQVHKMGETRRVPIFFSSLFDGLKQSWIVVATFLVPVAFQNYIPEPEFKIFSNNLYAGIAMAVLFMVSYFVVLILVAAYCLSLFTLESTVHKLTLKLLARTVTFTIRFSDYFMTFLQKVPFIVAAALIALSFSTCGGLALCVGLVFYFLKLTQMSQDYVEQVAYFMIKNIARQIKRAFCKRKDLPTNTDNAEPLSIEGGKKKETLDESDQKITKGSLTTDTSSIPSSSSQSSTRQLIIADESDAKCEDITDQNTSEAKSGEPVTEALYSEPGTSNTKSRENIGEGDEQIKEDMLKSEVVSTVEDRTEEIGEAPEVGANERGGSIKDLTETNNAIFFHSSIFFIWALVTILNIPAVLTWAHNFKHSRNLSPDESLMPGLIFSIGAFFLWQFELPRTDRKFTTLLRVIILCMIPISFLYAPVSIYRLNYMLTFLFALVLLQQCCAPKIETDNELKENDDCKEEENKYDEVKMKMD